MDDVAGIAKGLSEGGKAYILSLPGDGSWRETPADELDGYGKDALRGFGKKGITEGIYHDPMRHRLTPLGLRVRAHLERTNHG